MYMYRHYVSDKRIMTIRISDRFVFTIYAVDYFNRIKKKRKRKKNKILVLILFSKLDMNILLKN
jgi:hypothetical protein